MDKEYLAALSTTIGTIIGAGILALPYAVSRSGFLNGLIIFLIVGIASIMITLYTGELSFRENKMHQLPVMIGKYLGIKFKLATLLLQILTIYGALIAYLTALGAIFVVIFNIPYMLSVSIIFLLTLPLIFKGYDIIEQSETPLSIMKILLIIIVSVILLSSFNLNNLRTNHFSNLFSSFGVVLFALTAYTVIPEVKQEIKNNAKKLTSVILVSYIISISIYVLFTLAFIGEFGQNVAIIATNSVSSGWFMLLLLVTSIFLLVTPYLALGLVITDSFYYDFNIGRFKSLLIGVFVPFFVVLFDFGFESVLSITGGIFISLLAIFILMAVYISRKRSGISKRYNVKGGLPMIIFTGLVMIIGLIYTIIYI